MPGGRGWEGTIAPNRHIVVSVKGRVPTEEQLRSGQCLRIHGEPVISRRSGGALLHKGVRREEAHRVNLGVRSKNCGSGRIIELLGPVGIKALGIFTRFERLRPERHARMTRLTVWALGHVTPDRKREDGVRVNAILQPRTPDPDIIDWAGVNAAEIVGYDKRAGWISRGIYIQSSQDIRTLEELHAVGFGTTGRRRLVRARGDLEREIQTDIVQVIIRLPCSGDRSAARPLHVRADVKLPR